MKRIFRRAGLILPLFVFFVAFRGLAQTASVPAPNLLPGDDTTGAAAVAQQDPAVARGGNNFLVVWSDRRSTPPDTGDAYETAKDIYAMRLDSAGNPLDSLPFVVTQAPGNQDRPQVAWDGTNWLVVFESTALNGIGTYFEQSLAVVRVAPDGQILDPQPVQIFNTTPVITSWSVASDGNGWVVAFQGSSAGNDLQVIRINANGQIQQPPVSLVPETYFLRFHLHLAYANGVFLLTWTDVSDTKGLRFNTSFTPLDAAPFVVVANNQGIASLISNGSQFYALWLQQQADFSMSVTGSRITTDGVVLDGAGDNISGANQPVDFPSAAWDGTNWHISWGSSSTVSVARVNVDGQVLDPGGIPVSGPGAGPSTGDGSGGIQLVWTLFATDQSDIVSAHISSENSASPNITLSTGAPMQLYADFAAGNSGYMAVYRSDTDNAHYIHAHPLDANGDPLTAEPVELASGDTIYGPGHPSVAWNGSLYLAAWSSSSGIVAQRIQQDGTLVDASPFVVLAASFGNADVAAVNGDFLVVGLRYYGNPQFVYGVAARVRGSDGVVLDASPLVVGDSYARSVAVTPFGGRWLMVWFSTYTHDDSVGSTAGNFINPDGTLDTSFSIYGPYSMGGNGINEVSAASNGATALVLQSAEVTSGVETDLVGRLVNSNGTLQPAINLTPWEGNQYRARAAWDGSQYVVAYTDQKNRFDPNILDQLDARGDLFGMRVSASGNIIDPQGFAFSISPNAETHPNVAATNGISLFSGSVMRNEAPFAAYRVGYTRMGVGGNQWPVAAAQTSSSGGDTPLNVQFTSTSSTDPDGTIASFAWDFGDGGTSSAASPSHTFTLPGNYVVTLTVTDNQGATSTQTLPVSVTFPNQLPIVVASASPAGGQPPLDVTFRAAGSYDPDGKLGNFHWVFSTGSDYWGPTTYESFPTAGIYQATLTSWDNRGGSSSDTITIYVGQPNQAPVAAASGTPLNGDAPLQVTLSSVGSYDPDGTLASYQWVFGDGGTSTLAQATHTYTTAGSYQVTLTVTDNLGLTDTDSLTINVGQPNQSPVAVAGATPLSGNAPLEVSFSSADSYDPDGTLVGYLWDFGDGTTTTLANPSHTYTTPGSFQVTLTVTDNLNSTGSDILTIVVHDATLTFRIYLPVGLKDSAPPK